MHLFKETYDGPNYEYYKKEYNSKGLLIFEDKGFYGFWTKKEISYDEEDRISKIKEIEIGHKEYNQEDKLLHVYEYTRSNYRITTYKTHRRDIGDINTYENLVLGIEKWHDVDEVVAIRECKLENENLVSERYHNLETGEKSSSRFVYKNNKIVTETKTDFSNNIEQTNYMYEANLLKCKDYFYNNAFVHKIVYLYKEGLIEEEQTIRRYNKEEYLASTIKYYYDTKNEVVRNEHYGRFNSKMYLCKVVEITKVDNTTSWKTSSISCHETYTGYFDLNELNEANRKEFADCKVAINQANIFAILDTAQREYNMIEADFFDTLEFDENILTIETYDHKDNPLEYKSLNPSSQELYERLIYHHEYNEESQLELSICFSVNDKCEIEKKSVRRLYYRD